MRLLRLAITAALLLHLGAALATDPSVIFDSLEKQYYSTTVIVVIPASTVKQISSSFSVTAGKIQVTEATAGGKTVQDAGPSLASDSNTVSATRSRQTAQPSSQRTDSSVSAKDATLAQTPLSSSQPSLASSQTFSSSKDLPQAQTTQSSSSSHEAATPYQTPTSPSQPSSTSWQAFPLPSSMVQSSSKPTESVQEISTAPQRPPGTSQAIPTAWKKLAESSTPYFVAEAPASTNSALSIPAILFQTSSPQQQVSSLLQALLLPSMSSQQSPSTLLPQSPSSAPANTNAIPTLQNQDLSNNITTHLPHRRIRFVQPTESIVMDHFSNKTAQTQHQ